MAAVYQLYLNQMLQIRWRRWLTEHYLDRWLRDRAYYRMQLADSADRQPGPAHRRGPQASSSTLTLRLALGLLRQVGDAGLVRRDPVRPLRRARVRARGHAGRSRATWCGSALVYAIVGTWLTHRIGRPLIGLNFHQQRFEADFRFCLVRLRENTEGVALYGGEADERRRFRGQFGAVVGNWWEIMKAQKRLTWFTSCYGQAAVVFPFMMAAPRYFSGAIQLGGLMQTASAFGQVQDALSYFVDCLRRHRRMAGGRRSGWPAFGARRERAQAEAVRHHRVREPRATPMPSPLDGLALDLPDGARCSMLRAYRCARRKPCSCPARRARARARCSARSPGSGRSAGPHRACRCKRARSSCRRSRICRSRRCARSVRYPSGERSTMRRSATRSTRSGCPRSRTRLDEERHWALRLSPGEQQRIAFARALVQRPDWLFLDEATSALDEATEARLYALLRERLPETTVVSIGHRSTLAAFHDRQLAMEPESGLTDVSPRSKSAARAEVG